MMDMFPAKTLLEVEKFMVEQEQVWCPVFHKFSPGLYIRELHMPVDTIVLGHYHRFPNLCFFERGKLAFHNEDGTNTIMEAPQVFTAPPGRKLAYVMEEAVFTNVLLNPDNEQDVNKLEDIFFDKSVALPSSYGCFTEIEEAI